MFPIKDDNPTETRPYITCILISINILVYFYQLGLAETDNYELVIKYGFKPNHLFAHRWRYAMVEKAAGEVCFWDEAQHIGACGDWCIGPRIEAAFDSGLALAEKVSSAL